MKEIILTDDHYNSFGRIVFGYAAAETGFKILLSAMLKLDLGVFMAVSAPYQTSDLKNVVKSIAKLSTFDDAKEFKMIIDFTGRFQSYSKIRTYIAHCRWTEGTRPGSIRPISANVREGKLVTQGYSEDEKDFTVDELFENANGLFQLNNDLRNFINDYGYAAIIEEKMRETS